MSNLYSSEQQAVARLFKERWINDHLTVKELQHEVTALEEKIANYQPNFFTDPNQHWFELTADLFDLHQELEARKAKLEKLKFDLGVKADFKFDFTKLNHAACKTYLDIIAKYNK